MGGRKSKRKKVAEIGTFSNVLQCFDFNEHVLYDNNHTALSSKGKWKEIFGNDHPIVLELACGKGDYTVALAKKYPEKNFVGIDIKGARLFTGAKICLTENITNVRFARFKIENICHFFAPEEVSEIWITFPDPFPKDKHEKHRLTHRNFLEKYRQILRKHAHIHLKTDDVNLIQYSRESVTQAGGEILYYKEDIYATPLDVEELNIKTFYELQHLAAGRKIHYMRFLL